MFPPLAASVVLLGAQGLPSTSATAAPHALPAAQCSVSPGLAAAALAGTNAPPYAPDDACPPQRETDRNIVHDPKHNEWEPWTHQPECEYAVDRRIRYCAYTDARRGPRGWSIVTTPQTAEGLLELKALGTGGPAKPAGSPSSEPEDQGRGGDHDPPYEVVDMPGKGKGVVATRPIRRYEEIMVDYAALVVDIGFTRAVPAALGYRVLHAAVDRLADPGSVLGLGQSNEFALDGVENVVRTNAFHTEVRGAPHVAVYPTVSRINHACKPNAYTRFRPESLEVSIAAAKDIQKGEEITISYLTLGKPSSERKESLKRWGFECQCSLCTASKEEIAASDARRKQIATLRDYAVRAFQTGKPYQALRFTRQSLGLLPSEELFPMFSEHYENMARIFWVLGDRKNAEKWGSKSLQTLIEQGYMDESAQAEQLEKLWEKFREEESGRN